MEKNVNVSNELIDFSSRKNLLKKKNYMKLIIIIILFLDSLNGFGVVSAKFEDIPILNNSSVDNIYSFIESRIKLDVVKPLPFTIYQYSDVESAFR